MQLMEPPQIDEIDPPETGECGGDDDGSEGWITVATFWQPTEAHIARLKLESEEIDCVLIDENLVAMDWLYANAVGGIKLRVPTNEAQRAREILSERSKPARDTDFEVCSADDCSLRCPQCGCSNVDRPFLTRRNLWAAVAIMLLSTTVLFFALPVLFVVYFVWLRPYQCESCDHVWQTTPRRRGFEVGPPPPG
jgi:hypothetical protein